MKKTLFILFALVISITIAKAQETTHDPVPAITTHIEMSATFDEPEDGWNKLLQLKNGNTFFFHFTKKEGIEVIVYDKNRKKIAGRTLTSDLWDPRRMKESVVEGLYEINGEPVIFLQQVQGRVPTLYRIRLNPNTGAIVQEKEMGTLPKVSMFAGYAVAFGHADMSDFIVEKDPASDCYAVVFFNGFAHESDERIKVKHYNGNHKLLASAYFDSPDGQYKYLRFIGMTVDGDKRVYLCTYGFNTANSGGKDSRVIVSKLGAGDSVFTSKLLDFTEDFQDTKSIMDYNRGTNQIELLTLTRLKTKTHFMGGASTYYLTLLNYIDPESLAIVDSKTLAGEKINEYAHNTLDIKRDYSGVPQQMIINKDHTTTVLSEEMTEEVTQDARTGAIISAQTKLGAIGVSELDENGAEKNGYAIIKLQVANGLFDPLYISQKGKGKWSYRAGAFNNNAFLSFDYVNTDHGRYILFNDYPKNYDREEGERKRKAVVTISKANTVCYKLNSGQMNKYYLFGEPKDDDESKFCYIESSHYLADQNTYATLLMERNGRDKQARIAWVTFE